MTKEDKLETGEIGLGNLNNEDLVEWSRRRDKNDEPTEEALMAFRELTRRSEES